ncbi:MAG: cupin domain-containing protein [Deltaproteobacteria bacterium]|nr:cupin domain-containing protein [Deltaproteobacteria bacterium]
MRNEPIIRKMSGIETGRVDGAEGAAIQVLLGPNDEMPHFYTRVFTLDAGARIPKHRHRGIEHEQVILEGEMVLMLENKEVTVSAGDVVYLPADQFHGYENRGENPARFLCMVPAVEYNTEWL